MALRPTEQAQMALSWLTRRVSPARPSTSKAFDLYVSESPNAQNAIDAVTGWRSAFPPQYGLKAGPLAAYDDPWIHWAIRCFGSLDGRHVLELGPLEAAHTSMLEAAGARVDVIESDQLAFTRCLIAKEILGLARSKFWLGDFMEALEKWEQRYDMIVARGSADCPNPLRLIELAAKRTDALCMWAPLSAGVRNPQTARQHRSYGIGAWISRPANSLADDVASCGGVEDQHRRLHRDKLKEALTGAGFKEIRMSPYEPTHLNGPALSLFARK
jgi:hypothetical protein